MTIVILDQPRLNHHYNNHLNHNANHATITTTTLTAAPTTPPSQQPHVPLNKPRHHHHLNHNANHNYANHLTTFPATPTADPLLHTPSRSPLRSWRPSLRSKRNQGFQEREGETNGTPMARGFSRLIFPRFGVGEGRFGSKVKGHVKEGPHFGGMNLPELGPCNNSLGPRAPRGEGARG